MYRGKPLPWSKREEVQKLVGSGATRREAAEQLALAYPTVVKYAKGILRGSLYQNCCTNSTG